MRLLPQTGEDLGSRMSHAFDAVFGMGYRRAILTGSDVPSLSASVYGEALKLLQDHDLVLGPSMDGGYYLIGLTHPVPDLFTGIPWSTNQVFDLTMKKAHNLPLKTAVLPSEHDLDTMADLQRLIDEDQVTAVHLSKRTRGVLHLLAGRLASRSRT